MERTKTSLRLTKQRKALPTFSTAQYESPSHIKLHTHSLNSTLESHTSNNENKKKFTSPHNLSKHMLCPFWREYDNQTGPVLLVLLRPLTPSVPSAWGRVDGRLEARPHVRPLSDSASTIAKLPL